MRGRLLVSARSGSTGLPEKNSRDAGGALSSTGRSEPREALRPMPLDARLVVDSDAENIDAGSQAKVRDGEVTSGLDVPLGSTGCREHSTI